MNLESNSPIYARIVARAWTDETFEAALLANPTRIARESGMALPNDAVVTVVANGAGLSLDTSGEYPTLALGLPPRPRDLEDESILADGRPPPFACGDCSM